MTNYAYIHCKPDGTPFYVGKGALRRVKYFGERNPHHQNIVAKYGKKNILYGMLECSNADIALQLEQGIIKCLQRSGYSLCNLTAGGDGGRSPAPETRAKLSAAAKKRGVSKACQEAKVKSKKGKPLSEEQKQKLRIAQTGRIFSDEHRKNISIAAKKRGMSLDVIAKAHAALVGRVQSAEERAKRSAAIKLAWAKKKNEVQ
jgi:hypothetical protein